MKHSVIFLAGVHGAGKGTFAHHLQKSLGLKHFSSSALIKEQKKAPVDVQKIALDPEMNQFYLVKAIQPKLEEHETILLDGHFTLFQSDCVYEVPIEVFQALPIAGIILLTENSEKLADRLCTRDGSSPSVENIQQLQNAERTRAEHVSKKLFLPLLNITSEDHAVAECWIIDLMHED